MSRLTRRFFCLAVLAVSISLLAACQKMTPDAPDLPDLKVGVVGVEQPTLFPLFPSVHFPAMH